MDTNKLIKGLKKFVEERNPHNFSLDNSIYDSKLLKAYNLLAGLYYDIGAVKQSHSCLREAEYEFHRMLENGTEKEGEISRYSRKLMFTAMQIGYPLEEKLRISCASMLIGNKNKNNSYNLWDVVKDLESDKFKKKNNENNKYKLDDFLDNDEDPLDSDED